MKKRVLSLILAVVLACALAAPAGAYDMGKEGEYNVISCGTYHAAAVDESGALWTWGGNNYGQLGNGTNTDPNVPVKVMDNVAAVSCGGAHTAAIKTDGTLWMWGDNRADQLGNGTKTGSNVPVKVMDNVAAVSCGANHTAALKTDGTLWVWGDKNSNVPGKVMDGVAAVSCGANHTAAIKTDGTLWMWGENQYGQYGDGTTEASGVPVKVLDNVAAVSCGGGSGSVHTAAIKTDGTLWMWGSNNYGQLGTDGTGNAKDKEGKTIQTVPVKVMDNVAAVDCGGFSTAAIKTDGTLWTWGLNGGGLQPSGVPVHAMDSVAAVNWGGCIIIKTDGTLWRWEKSVPVKIALGGGASVRVPASAQNRKPTAYPSTQTVDVDGKAIEFQCYALKEGNGMTNYIKLRDLADILNGSAVQFEVGWNGNVTITTGKSYTKNGSEQNTPFSGNRTYKEVTDQTMVDGKAADLAAFTLTDDAGGGYTYYKLRDLGAALGFKVDWTAERGIFIETK